MVNKKATLLFFLIITGISASILNIQKVYEDKKIIDSFNKDVLKIYLYNRYENKFDYFKGLWLIPSGLFFVFLLALLDVPSPKEAFKKLKDDLKYKKLEMKYRKK